MKEIYIILIFLITQTSLGFTQEDWVNSICDCYKDLDYSIPFEDTKSQVENCVKKESKKYKADLDLYFEKSNNSLQFLQEIGSNCPEFCEFVARFGLDDADISNEERIDIIDYLAAYFSYPIEKGKRPRTYTIIPTQQGVLYNSYFNQIYPDSLFNEGHYALPFYDSLIIFDLFPQRYSTEIELKLADNSTPKLDLTYVIELKKDRVGHLLKNFRFSYDKTLLIPEVRVSTRNALEKLTIIDLNKLTEEEFSQKIIDETLNTDEFQNYAILIKVYIDHIDYPKVLKAAFDADLVKEYNDLKENEIDIRLRAIDRLIEDSSESAYMILLNHWQFENSNNVKDYIIKKLTRNNN